MQASKWLEAVELWHKLLMLVVTAFVEEWTSQSAEAGWLSQMVALRSHLMQALCQWILVRLNASRSISYATIFDSRRSCWNSTRILSSSRCTPPSNRVSTSRHSRRSSKATTSQLRIHSSNQPKSASSWTMLQSTFSSTQSITARSSSNWLSQFKTNSWARTSSRTIYSSSTHSKDKELKLLSRASL
jgi:hypothetical protein